MKWNSLVSSLNKLHLNQLQQYEAPYMPMYH